MTWQDELRQLDEELAAGRLSADDYRRRRDDLLSQSASTAAPAHPPASSGPFPPPFRWDESPSEKTQHLTPIRDEPPAGWQRPAQGDDSERTQVVGQTTPPPVDAERTQVVPGQVPPPGQQGPPRPLGPPVGFPNQQQPPPPPPGYGQTVPPWQQSPGTNPPWGAADLPPTTDVPPAWLRQGPEAFESTGGSRSGKVIAGVVALLVVAALGAGAFIMFRPDGNPTGPSGSTTVASPSTTAAPTTTEPPRPIVQPPGSVQIDDTYTLPRLRDAKLLSTEDFAIVEANKVSEAQVTVTKQGELTLGAWAFQVASTAAGEKMLTQIDQLYTGVAFRPAEGVTRDKVSALVLAPPAGQAGFTVYRAHYLGQENRVVRVEAYGPDGAAAKAAFIALLDNQLKQLAPA